MLCVYFVTGDVLANTNGVVPVCWNVDGSLKRVPEAKAYGFVFENVDGGFYFINHVTKKTCDAKNTKGKRSMWKNAATLTVPESATIQEISEGLYTQLAG